MRGWMALAALALATVSGFGAGEAQAKKPKLKKCPVLQPLGPGEMARTDALLVPRDLRKVAVATKERLAVSALDGSTLCIDMRLRGEVTGMAITPDRRFVSFDWAGYEAAGHIIVDRSGSGQQIDTGGAPSVSPSRNRWASVNQGDAAYAELDGFAVWQVQPVGIRQVAVVSDIPDLADWRIDTWVREDCIDLSGIPFARLTSRPGQPPSGVRDRYMAMPFGSGWRVVRTTRGCAG